MSIKAHSWSPPRNECSRRDRIKHTRNRERPILVCKTRLKMEILKYKLIRSKRKTLALELRPEGLIVRAPYRTANAQIEQFIRDHASWIRKHQEKMERAKASQPGGPADGETRGPGGRLTEAEIRELAGRAKEVIPGRAAFYAEKIGVDYGRITIRAQRTRWGSCSAKGNLNFNCLLMLTPPEVLDSVVVHELCHRKEMNHSAGFYNEVLKVFPDYRKWQKWLKENGGAIMKRMTG